MEAPNISYILWGWPLLDGFDFLRVNMYPIFVVYKTLKHYTINTKSAFIYISKQTIFPKH